MTLRSFYASLICFFTFCSARAELKPASTYTVHQEVQYRCENAEEVFFVWGINNWNEQDKALWPKGTFKKGKLLYTPMEKIDGVFKIQLSLIPQTMLDYVFWITKGPRGVPGDIWDVNKAPQKDYHTLAMNDNTVLIHSNSEIRPKQQLSVLDFSGSILLLVLLFTAAGVFFRKHRYATIPLSPGPYKIVLVCGGVLLFFLFLGRASVAAIGWDLYYHPFSNLFKLLWAGLYDHVFVLSVTAFFLLFLFLLRKYPRIQMIITGLFILAGLFIMITGILNIRLVEIFGKPFNFRWFYYSGFLKSADAHAAIASNISASYLLKISLICIAAVLTALILLYCIECLLLKFKIRKPLLILFIFFNLGYMALGHNLLPSYKIEYDRLANPIVSFLESANPWANDPKLYTMQIPDSLKFVPPTVISKNTATGEIKNVLIVVLESTAAEYVQPYDKIFKVTPELEKNLDRAVVFENMYAHAPATNKSMVCLLGSVYPWLSFASITQEHPAIQIPTLGSELKNKNYRTAFFNSGDNRFQKAGEFLQNHGFDQIKDCKTMACSQQFAEKNEKWSSLDGMNDQCSANELLSWIKQEPTQPFFSVLWTYQTHYPYYSAKPEKNYCNDSILNRYLNAVEHSDKMLGKILNELTKSGLDSSTLVVVLGDHGEAFGRHDQTTHASKIYEENVHIPCFFINPFLHAGSKKEIGGLVDVAPSILSLLGFTSPGTWQGRDLFTGGHYKTYFFCPWSDYLFGYREGSKKYIYNASQDLTEIYDLDKDPLETRNLVTEEETAVSHQKLAAWIQYQDKFMKSVLEKPAK